MTTLFISDLHLDPSRPQVTRLFRDFLAGEAREAEALYILGDLFEAWIGDDAAGEEDQETIRALRQLTDSGVPAYFMRGNRDFLVGEEFARQTGMVLLEDPQVVELYGEKVLLSHGDMLCIDDTDHMAFREMVLDPAWQRDFLSRSIAERQAFADRARAESMRQGQTKSLEIMDVNPEEVARVMRENGVQRLIHGHTHRPDVHEFELEGRAAQRIVLGDWFDQGSVLRVQPGDYRLETLPLDS